MYHIIIILIIVCHDHLTKFYGVGIFTQLR